MVKMHVYESPADFLGRVESVLLEDEVLNNLPLGILYRLVESDKAHSKEPFMAVVSDSDQNQHLVLLQSMSHLVMYASRGMVSGGRLGEACQHAIECIVSNDKLHIPSVIGPREQAFEFAEEWKRLTNQSYRIGMNQRIYCCKEVRDLPFSPGIFRAAERRDIPILTQWIHDFSAEATGENMTEEQAYKVAESATARSALYVWDHDGPVSMAQQTRPTQHGAVVNLVYTPPEYRNLGYARSCVAALTRNMLRGPYQFASLYTDLDNPVSNKIYMNIGYEPLADSVLLKFD